MASAYAAIVRSYPPSPATSMSKVDRRRWKLVGTAATTGGVGCRLGGLVHGGRPVGAGGSAARLEQQTGDLAGRRLRLEPGREPVEGRGCQGSQRAHDQEHDQKLDQREAALGSRAHQLVRSWFSPSPPSWPSAPRV